MEIQYSLLTTVQPSHSSQLPLLARFGSHRGHVVRAIQEVRREERHVRQLCLVQPHAQRYVTDEEHA